MASFNPPSTFAKSAHTAPSYGAARMPLIEPGIAERYEAARQCTLCRMAGSDRPGWMCTGPMGEIECGEPLPLYSRMVDAYLASPTGQSFVRKYVAR